MNDIGIAFLGGFTLGGCFGLWLLYIGIQEIKERYFEETP